MANKIAEKYFTQGDFFLWADEALEQVKKETGFAQEKEIWRGVLYDKDKVGSIIYRGTLKEKPAVLKLQGLKPEIDEGEMLKHFTAQNKSKIVRVPRLYAHRPWLEERRYGYLITEYIDAPRIFEMPFASEKQMQDFARFYQEYKTLAVTRPWIAQETKDSFAFTMRRVENWQKISASKARLRGQDHAPYMERFAALARTHFASIPMEFCHGHLDADNILKDKKEVGFVLFSNLYWSWRPQWYDLAFNVWNCLLHIRNVRYSFHDMIKYVEQWLAVYREIPTVKADKDFERKIKMMILERTIGAILVDLGVNDMYEEKTQKKYFEHLLCLHQKLFHYLADQLI